jgi:hypothetical protein
VALACAGASLPVRWLAGGAQASWLAGLGQGRVHGCSQLAGALQKCQLLRRVLGLSCRGRRGGRPLGSSGGGGLLQQRDGRRGGQLSAAAFCTPAQEGWAHPPINQPQYMPSAPPQPPLPARTTPARRTHPPRERCPCAAGTPAAQGCTAQRPLPRRAWGWGRRKWRGAPAARRAWGRRRCPAQRRRCASGTPAAQASTARRCGKPLPAWPRGRPWACRKGWQRAWPAQAKNGRWWGWSAEWRPVQAAGLLLAALLRDNRSTTPLLLANRRPTGMLCCAVLHCMLPASRPCRRLLHCWLACCAARCAACCSAPIPPPGPIDTHRGAHLQCVELALQEIELLGGVGGAAGSGGSAARAGLQQQWGSGKSETHMQKAAGRWGGGRVVERAISAAVPPPPGLPCLHTAILLSPHALPPSTSAP